MKAYSRTEQVWQNKTEIEAQLKDTHNEQEELEDALNGQHARYYADMWWY